jgi:hypothetical protein
LIINDLQMKLRNKSANLREGCQKKIMNLDDREKLLAAIFGLLVGIYWYRNTNDPQCLITIKMPLSENKKCTPT